MEKQPCVDCGEPTRRTDGELFRCKECATVLADLDEEEEDNPTPRNMDAAQLIELIEDAGFAPRSYSGRGMYGKRCLGVNLDGNGDLVSLAGAPRPSTDSMGLGIVAYWPNIAPPDGFTEKD